MRFMRFIKMASKERRIEILFTFLGWFLVVISTMTNNNISTKIHNFGAFFFQFLAGFLLFFSFKDIVKLNYYIIGAKKDRF